MSEQTRPDQPHHGLLAGTLAGPLEPTPEA